MSMIAPIKQTLLALLLAALTGLSISLYVTTNRLQQAKQRESLLQGANAALQARVKGLQRATLRAETATKVAQEANNKAATAAAARKDSQHDAIQDHKAWAYSPIPPSVANWVLDGASGGTTSSESPAESPTKRLP